MKTINFFVVLCVTLCILCIVAAIVPHREAGLIGSMLDKPSDILARKAELARVQAGHVERMELLKLAARPYIPPVFWFFFSFLVFLCGILVAVVVFLILSREKEKPNKINMIGRQSKSLPGGGLEKIR